MPTPGCSSSAGAAFGESLDRPAVRAFWWPRFERIARWFVDNEAARRPLLAASLAEAKGELLIELAGLPALHLAGQGRPHRPPRRGRACDHRLQDRRRAQQTQVGAGYAPQLPLEAAMARAGGFEGIGEAVTAELAYWRLRGGREIGDILMVPADPMILAAAALGAPQAAHRRIRGSGHALSAGARSRFPARRRTL